MNDREYHDAIAACWPPSRPPSTRWLQDDVVDIDTHTAPAACSNWFPRSKIVVNTQPPLHEDLAGQARSDGGFRTLGAAGATPRDGATSSTPS